MPTLLVVHHTVSPAMAEALEAVQAGIKAAQDAAEAELDLRVEPALSATAADVLSADAVVLGTPANIGYMSGAAKHFFDQIYYPVLDARVGLPFATYVHGNDDCAGAVKGIEKITNGLKWHWIQPAVTIIGALQTADKEAVRELGENAVGAALGLLPN